MKVVTATFHTIALKRKSDMKLHSYCTELEVYYKSKETCHQFKRVYDKEYLAMDTRILEEKMHQEAYRNGVVASITGVRKVKQNLEADCSNMSSHPTPDDEKIGESSSMRSLGKVSIHCFKPWK